MSAVYASAACNSRSCTNPTNQTAHRANGINPAAATRPVTNPNVAEIRVMNQLQTTPMNGGKRVGSVNAKSTHSGNQVGINKCGTALMIYPRGHSLRGVIRSTTDGEGKRQHAPDSSQLGDRPSAAEIWAGSEYYAPGGR